MLWMWLIARHWHTGMSHTDLPCKPSANEWEACLCILSVNPWGSGLGQRAYYLGDGQCTTPVNENITEYYDNHITQIVLQAGHYNVKYNCAWTIYSTYILLMLLLSCVLMTKISTYLAGNEDIFTFNLAWFYEFSYNWSHQRFSAIDFCCIYMPVPGFYSSSDNSSHLSLRVLSSTRQRGVLDIWSWA